MITQLYIERLADGRYDVVCNDYAVTTKTLMRSDIGDIDGIGFAISALTEPERDDCEYADDMAGVRIGYMPFDMLGMMYCGVDRIVPAGEREMVARQLMAVQDAS